MTLRIVPMNRATAYAFIQEHHRHHRPPSGFKFALGVADDHQLVGVATVGIPVARHQADGLTLEVTRTCTDGTRNANSLLYGAAWRVTRELGYTRLITYTQEGESGASLRGAGWRVIGHRKPRGGWDTPSRPRTDTHPLGVARTVWEAQA